MPATGDAAVTIRWHTSPPTSVDERLVVATDGRARLVVARPRSARDRIGVYAGEVSAVDVAELAALGPTIDLDLVVPDPARAAVGAAADRVAAGLRETPQAVVRFALHPLGPTAGGSLDLALLVSGEGDRDTELVLTLPACAVHCGDGSHEIGWQPMPSVPIGFMTQDAEGLGGVGDQARVPPDVTGAVAFAVAVPAGTTQVWMQVGGLLFDAGSEPPSTFEAWTPAVAVTAG